MGFYWNEDTIGHFKFMSSYISESELEQEIKKFVEINCTVEDGETEEELSNDLFTKIIK